MSSKALFFTILLSMACIARLECSQNASLYPSLEEEKDVFGLLEKGYFFLALSTIEQGINDSHFDSNRKKNGKPLFCAALELGYQGVAEQLIGCSTFDPNQTDAQGKPIVFTALERGYTVTTLRLVRRTGFNPNAQYNKKPFFYAALELGYQSVADQLTVCANFDPNQTDAQGKPIVFTALERGYPVTASNIMQRSTFDPHQELNDEPIAIMMLKAGYSAGYSHLFQQLMNSRNFNINKQYGKDLHTLAHLAVLCNMPNLLQKLLERKDCNLAITNEQSESAFRMLMCRLQAAIDKQDILEKNMPLLDVFIHSDTLNSLPEQDAALKESAKIFAAYGKYFVKKAWGDFFWTGFYIAAFFLFCGCWLNQFAALTNSL